MKGFQNNLKSKRPLVNTMKVYVAVTRKENKDQPYIHCIILSYLTNRSNIHKVGLSHHKVFIYQKKKKENQD